MEPEASIPLGRHTAAGHPRMYYGVGGVAAVGCSLAVSELIAGLFLSAPSLILAIGHRVIDLTPAAVEDWAISTFGTNDKLVLIVGIVVVCLVLGAVVGVLAEARPGVGVAAFALFGAVGYAAGLSDPLAGATFTLVNAAAAVLSGVGVLLGLRSLLRRAGAADSVPVVASRRSFLTASGAAVALAGGTVALGRFFADRTRSGLIGREQVTLPTAAATPTTSATTTSAPTVAAIDAVEETVAGTVGTTLPVEPQATTPVSTLPSPTPAQMASVPGVSPLVTPNEDFYRIDTALSIPRVDLDTWTLSFTGLVDSPFSLDYDELLALPMVERYVTLCCVSNPVGGELVGNAKWLGAPLRDLVEMAGVRPEGTQLIGRSVDRFTVGFPTEAVFDGREALVAVGMNGEPLPLRHGFPARLVVSGLYGYVSATKWLSEVEFAGWDDFDAYWIPRGWAKEAPIKTQSRIDTPRQGTVTAGINVIAGVAWAQSRGVERVEVQVDDGPWIEATLPDELSIDSWRQWHLEHDLSPGRHEIAVRATDTTGETQTADIASPRPDGATGYHTVRVEAA